MPLEYDLGTGLLITRYNLSLEWINVALSPGPPSAFQGLADRGDGEELIDTKVVGLHSTDSQL